MSLLIHRAERADRLSTALGEVLSRPLQDPFATEIVCVPTRGVERWLAQRLSHQLGTVTGGDDGVCAGVEFSSPRRLMARALSGQAVPAAEDPWVPARAVWPLLRVIDRARDEPWLALLWSNVHGDRRWSIARHLAGLFATYASNRPAMIQHWLEGRDVDGSDRPLVADRAWQAELWRRLRRDIDTPSPAERIRTAAAKLADAPDTADLPSRLSLFGATRIDPDHVLVLRALAKHRDVHLWLPHPSPVLWERLAEAPELTLVTSRMTAATAALAEHRLLGYLGRDSRELQQVLAAGGESTDVSPPAPNAWPDHLLGWLQRDIAGNRAPPPPQERPLLRSGDRSIELHASHGPDRQVEVLRELLVGLLADEPSLEPRDIVVMCPDIETYAPLIAASFGLDDGENEAEHPGHRLRVRLADRSLRQVNPLLSTVSRLVALADSRMEASTLLDFCSTPPVARKFGFSTEDLDRLHDLVPRAGVRWGLDAEHRSPYGMADFRQNTWTAGLDRLLLGVAMDESEERFLGTALPLDDVDSSDVDLVGRLAECVDRIRTITDGFAARQPLPAWCEAFKRAIELLTSVAPAEGWQLAHAYNEISSLAAAASGPGAEVELSLAEVATLLGDAFRGRASRANFRTGTLTVCTMLPMRSIPHRVACLLGVDDGVFPRHSQPDGDDILALDPWVGDRDPRSEDRQLLLDAIMAAQDHLLIVYAGLDPRTGARRPPAVPIGELLDSLEETARTEDNTAVRSVIMTEHPLQPFDARNFVPAPAGGPFSFDRASWRGALAAGGPRIDPPPTYGSGPLPLPDPAQTVGLRDLIRFFNHPLRALLRDRAGLTIGEEEEPPVEQIPVDLIGLDHWAVGDRLLRRTLSGLALEQLVGAEWRRGRLPPRRLGQVAIDKVADTVRELQATASPYLAGPTERRDVALPLGDLLLTGTVSRLYGTNLVRVGFSILNARHRLQAWIELLALAAAYPDVEWRAVVLGRSGRALLGPVGADWAAKVLADLLDLRQAGLCEPLPFGPRTAYEYALLRADGKTVELFWPKLEKSWRAERDLAYERFFGTGATLDDMMRQPAIAAEARGDTAEPSRFGTLARRVFQPLISAETTE